MKLVQRVIAAVALIASFSVAAYGQVRTTRLTFENGPCVWTSGSGTPEGHVTGNVCDAFVRTDTGHIYTKQSGSGNTGWSDIGLPATVTANYVLAGPTSGSAAAPAFRALVKADQVAATAYMDAANTFVPSQAFTANINPSLGYTSLIGSLQTKFLALHAAELWVETLVAQNTLATIGGRILVAPTNILSADLAAAGTTMTVKYNNFANGDRVYMESNGKVEFFAVTSSAGGSSGAYTYTVTRNLDGSGANDWYAGDALLNTGTTGKGFIDLYSTAGVLSGSGPTIVGNQRTGTTYNNIAPRWAIGNLNGLYGYSTELYGSAFGDPSNANLVIDPTNGIRFRNGTTLRLTMDPTNGLRFFMSDGTTVALQLNMSGGAVFTGDVVVTGGNAATTTYASGVAATAQSTAISTASSDATTKANSAQSTAISTAASDATTKANSAISTASSDATTKASAAQSAAISAAASDATAKANAAAAASLDRATFLDSGPGTIKGTLITSSSITTSQIAANTIVAGNIAANTITANKMSISTLDAITANLGSVYISTSGSLSSGASSWSSGTGYWLEYNGGTPRMRIGTASGQRLEWDGSDLNIYGANYELSTSYGLHFSDASAESSYESLITWASGSEIGGNGNRTWVCGPNSGCSGFRMIIYGAGNIQFMNSSGDSRLGIDNTSVVTSVDFLPDANGNRNLGAYGSAWDRVYTNNITVYGDVSFDPPSTTSGDYPLVYSSGNHILYYKSNGATGSGCTSIDAENGIVVGCSGSLGNEVAALKQKVAELENLVNSLIAKGVR